MKFADNPDIQQMLAPYEHRAYYREYIHNPLTGAALAAAEPVYQGIKGIQQYFPSFLGNAMPRDKMTTPASFDQITQSWKGISEGMLGR
ncbi:MAG TPA: hypothetical protein VN368_02735 [Candidatus Methylomirabilis sp.]|nr:hypothetical protein [Candidatus Methylomirabilis sp.]